MLLLICFIIDRKQKKWRNLSSNASDIQRRKRAKRRNKDKRDRSVHVKLCDKHRAVEGVGGRRDGAHEGKNYAAMINILIIY